MSRMFEQIKEWYKNGYWSERKVRDAVKMGKITQEECDIILSIVDWISIDKHIVITVRLALHDYRLLYYVYSIIGG